MYEPLSPLSDLNQTCVEMQRCLNINGNVTTLLFLALRLGSLLRVRGQFVALIPLSLRCSAARRGIAPPPPLWKNCREQQKNTASEA